MKLDALIQSLKTNYGGMVGEKQKGPTTRIPIELASDKLFDAATAIQSDVSAEPCRLLFATASYIDADLFWINEVLCGDSIQLSLRVKVSNEAPIPSLTEIWEYADWQEREAHELFGLRFHRGIESEPFLLRNSRKQFPHRRQ